MIKLFQDYIFVQFDEGKILTTTDIGRTDNSLVEGEKEQQMNHLII